MAWIKDRLSVQMMICLLIFDVRWVQASVIAVSSVGVVVGVSRTIFGIKEGAHVHLASWKHGNGDTGLNMVCTQ